MKLAYCDYIASLLRDSLAEDDSGLISWLEVSRVQADLSPDGYLVSTKKTILAKDHQGKSYRVTVEEA
jgi:hypothetical protein